MGTTAVSPAPATLITAPRPSCRYQTSSLKTNTSSVLQASTSARSPSVPARWGSSALAAARFSPSPSVASAVRGLAA
eukprot:10451918-Alexandrium_andersonii.AAC.1